MEEVVSFSPRSSPSVERGESSGRGEMEDSGSHVVPLAAVGGEFLNGGKDVVEHVDGRIRGMAAANVAEAFELEFLAMQIARVGQTIGAEKERIAGFQLQEELIVGCLGKKAGRDAGDLQDLAILAAKKERAGHASADDAHLQG
jgi:hypothetical protein